MPTIQLRPDTPEAPWNPNGPRVNPNEPGMNTIEPLLNTIEPGMNTIEPGVNTDQVWNEPTRVYSEPHTSTRGQPQLSGNHTWLTPKTVSALTTHLVQPRAQLLQVRVFPCAGMAHTTQKRPACMNGGHLSKIRSVFSPPFHVNH